MDFDKCVLCGKCLKRYSVNNCARYDQKCHEKRQKKEAYIRSFIDVAFAHASKSKLKNCLHVRCGVCFFADICHDDTPSQASPKEKLLDKLKHDEIVPCKKSKNGVDKYLERCVTSKASPGKFEAFKRCLICGKRLTLQSASKEYIEKSEYSKRWIRSKVLRKT